MKFWLFILLLLPATCSIAQHNNKAARNSLSFELGKTGLIFNLSYDHKLAGKNSGLRVSAGSNFAKHLSAYTVGGGAYYLFGKTNKYLELGIDLYYLSVDEVSDDQKGFTLIYPDYTISTYYASLNIGFRSYGKRSLFRAGFSPGYIKSEFVPGGYLGIGIVF